MTHPDSKHEQKKPDAGCESAGAPALLAAVGWPSRHHPRGVNLWKLGASAVPLSWHPGISIPFANGRVKHSLIAWPCSTLPHNARVPGLYPPTDWTAQHCDKRFNAAEADYGRVGAVLVRDDDITAAAASTTAFTESRA